MNITVKGRTFEIYLSKSEVKKRIHQLGEQITRDFQGKEVVVLGVLNGSFIFMADLCREINLPVTCTFVKISSYQGTTTTGQVRSILGLDSDLKGKHVIIEIGRAHV